MGSLLLDNSFDDALMVKKKPLIKGLFGNQMVWQSSSVRDTAVNMDL